MKPKTLGIRITLNFKPRTPYKNIIQNPAIIINEATANAHALSISPSVIPIPNINSTKPPILRRL